MRKRTNWTLLNNISSLISERGLSLTDASQIMGVSRNTLGEFLNGRSNLGCYQFISLLKLAGINISQIIAKKIEQSQIETTDPIGDDIETLISAFSKNQKKAVVKDILSTYRLKNKNEDFNKSFYRLKEYMRSK